MRKWPVITALVVILWCILCGFAYAAEEVSLTVSADSEKLSAGDALTLTIDIHNAEELAMIQITLNYDENKLEYQSGKVENTVKKDSFVSQVKRSETGKIGFVTVMKDNKLLSGDTSLFSVTFTVREDAPAGNVDYSLTNIKLGGMLGNAVELDCFDKEHSSVIKIAKKSAISRAIIHEGILSVWFDESSTALTSAVALYNDFGMTACFLTEPCSGERVEIDISKFDGEYNRVKIFAFEDFDSLIPICEAADAEYNF